MPKVRCKHCKHLEEGVCIAKRSGGKHPKVKPNARRDCDKFVIDVIEMSKDADKEYKKHSIPKFAPTWRYYASKKELKELGEENGPLYVRTNPDAPKRHR